MAVTCVSTITPVEIPDIVAVSASISVDDGPVHIVTVRRADISTNAKKVAVADTVWRKFLAVHEKQLAEEAIAAEIDELQNTLNLNIQGRVV